MGLLAVDEEAGDLVTRLAQRVGVSRRECEARPEDVLEKVPASDRPAVASARPPKGHGEGEDRGCV